MKKVLSILLALCLVLSVAAVAFADAAAKDGGSKIIFTTGGEAGTYFGFGGVLAQKVSEVTSSKKDDCEQTEEAAEEEPFDAEEELNNLNEQLDDLADNLKDLNDEKDAAVEAVFEVVEDTPVEEPKPEEEKPAE